MMAHPEEVTIRVTRLLTNDIPAGFAPAGMSTTAENERYADA
jgi:hypothetical protein